MTAGAWRSLAALAAALVAISSFEARAEKRVALVIGNASYQSVPPLANPAKDTSAIAQLFKVAGFDVVQARNDLGHLEFKRAVREFTETSRQADIAVVYFGGHGIEIGGMNYLVPVDAKLGRDYDAEDEAVALDRLVRAIEPARRLRLVILDACRDNPFTGTMQRTAAVRAMARGLAEVEPTVSNTLIAFAARAGSTAADGDGANSPFTAALLNHIAQPGLDIQMALRRVRDEVRRNTGNRQDPFVYGSLGGDEIALVPHPPAAKQSVAVEPGAAARRDYELAERIGTADAWNTFLAAHGTGFHAHLARAQLAKLADDARRAAIERERAERAVREQREAGSRAEEERKGVARAQPERQESSAEAAREIQTAALSPRSEPAGVASVPPPAGAALIQEIKKELKRVGCYAGRIDEHWATADTKASIGRFVKYASLSTIPGEPTADFLDLLRGRAARVCTVVCGRGHRVEATTASRRFANPGSS